MWEAVGDIWWHDWACSDNLALKEGSYARTACSHLHS